MSETQTSLEKVSRNVKILFIFFVVGTGIVYFFSNPNPQFYYDYTFRVAANFFDGRIGFTEKPPTWLNEFVPFENYYYSVFPFGSVLTMLPFAVLKIAGLVTEMPAALISAITTSGIAGFLFLISAHYQYTWRKRMLISAAILFGSWMWTNLAMAGAWHLALGFAMLGELGAIYFTIYNRKPLLAGMFFALAFGNRTEILLTAPIFMFLLFRKDFQLEDAGETQGKNSKSKTEDQRPKTEFQIANRKSQISQHFAPCRFYSASPRSFTIMCVFIRSPISVTHGFPAF